MAWWPFRQGSFLDPEDEQWQIELWRWFLGHFGRKVDFDKTPLVLPTREFFPPTDKQGHERAGHVFECVKRLARMAGWPCRLGPQPDRPNPVVGTYTVLKPITQGPGGTFGWDGDEVMITYDPAAMQQPGKLVAILAHELAHYLLAGLHNDIPGGEALHEPATDVLTVYLGFGVFGAANAFNFSADCTGWQWSSGGYLSQRAWLFALGIFLELRGEKPDTVKPFLKSHLYSDLKTAIRHLRRRAIIAAITPSA